MNFLIDTHALIWYLDGNNRLPNRIRKELNNPDNQVSVSIVSIWELAIKISLKKIDTKITLREIETDILKRDITMLGISFEHLNILESLEHHHGDPFDRLIIAQSISEGVSIISADKQFNEYSVNIVW